MSFSGLLIKGLLWETQAWLREARIDKIYNYQNELHIYLYNHTERRFLVLSTDSRDFRLQLLTTKPDVTYPDKPSSFCMLLRRYLTGLPIENIIQPELERIITITFNLGYGQDLQTNRYRLICELMGRNSNLILVGPDNFILGAWRLSSAERNVYREVVPGAEYIVPPAQNGKDLLSIDSPYFRRSLLLAEPEGKLAQILVRIIQGIDLTIAEELLIKAGVNPNSKRADLKDNQLTPIWEQIALLQQSINANRWQPTLIVDQAEQPVDYVPIPITNRPNITYATFTQLLDTFYAPRMAQLNDHVQKKELETILKKELKKVKRKISAQEKDYAAAEDGAIYKTYADLIMANLHLIKLGSSTITLPAFEDGRPVIIPLDPALRGVKNAEDYYTKYAKANRKKKRSQEELQKSQDHLVFLEQLQEDLRQQETTEELLAIADELTELGLLRSKPTTRGTKRHKLKPQYKTIVIEEDTEVLIGKNSKQNDYITMQKAKPEDLWFHVKDLPGSHVILRTTNKSPSETAVLTAARLAATFSKAYQSTKVQVDFTHRKNVWKPRGAKSGMVLYENYKTLVVEPLNQRELQSLI